MNTNIERTSVKTIFDAITGKEILDIIGLEQDSGKVTIMFTDCSLEFYHKQDCCEQVWLVDFELDFNLDFDPYQYPVLTHAEEVVSDANDDCREWYMDIL